MAMGHLPYFRHRHRLSSVTGVVGCAAVPRCYAVQSTRPVTVRVHPGSLEAGVAASAEAPEIC